jgi:hypothetical protein
VFSLGSRTVVVGGCIPATAMPWHYLQGLPLLSQSLPNRFSLLADGAAAVILAFSLDLAWGTREGTAARRRADRRRRPRLPRPAADAPDVPRRRPGHRPSEAGLCDGPAMAPAPPSVA